MNGFNQIVSVSELARKSQAILKRVASANTEPIILFKRNKPMVVVINFEDYTALYKAKREKELKDALKTIKFAENELKEGRAKTMKKVSDLWENDENSIS